jgi:hypothetical protein
MRQGQYAARVHVFAVSLAWTLVFGKENLPWQIFVEFSCGVEQQRKAFYLSN